MLCRLLSVQQNEAGKVLSFDDRLLLSDASSFADWSEGGFEGSGGVG
jgi:hypothetical protein